MTPIEGAVAMRDHLDLFDLRGPVFHAERGFKADLQTGGLATQRICHRAEVPDGTRLTHHAIEEARAAVVQPRQREARFRGKAIGQQARRARVAQPAGQDAMGGNRLARKDGSDSHPLSGLATGPARPCGPCRHRGCSLQ